MREASLGWWRRSSRRHVGGISTPPETSARGKLAVVHPFRLRYVGLPRPSGFGTAAIEPGDTFGADGDGRLLGRGARDELLPHSILRKRRVRVTPEPGGFAVEDRGSALGVVVGSRVTRASLRPGDTLVVDGELAFAVESGVEEPRPIRRRTFRVENHTLSVVTDDGAWWTVLLDGRPAAMRLQRTSTVTTNAGAQSSEPTNAEAVATAALAPFADGEPTLASHPDGSFSLALFGLGMRSGAVYNTAVYMSRSMRLVFRFDGEPVEITVNDHADVST